jgi:signal peptidase
VRTRAALALAAYALAGFAVGTALVAGGPVLFGMRSFAVLSGSMEPVLSTGDVAVDRTVSPREVRVGDVVTYVDPERQGRRITHRVRSVHIAGNRARFVTKGDANDAGERWEMSADGRLGRVTYRVPMVGYVLARLGDPRAKVALLVVPALLLAILELVRIWRPRRREPEAADVAA